MGTNRDPSAFASATQVTLEQSASTHLTLGHEVHRCLGAPLARLQLTTLLAEFVRRFPDLRFARRVNRYLLAIDTGQFLE